MSVNNIAIIADAIEAIDEERSDGSYYECLSGTDLTRWEAETIAAAVLPFCCENTINMRAREERLEMALQQIKAHARQAQIEPQFAKDKAWEIEQIVNGLLGASVNPEAQGEKPNTGWDDYRAAVYDAYLAKQDEKRQP